VYNQIDVRNDDNYAATTDDFKLRGGLYGVTAKATWGGGSVTLKRKLRDGSYLTVLTAFTADGYAVVNLPNGVYRWERATASAIYTEIVSIAVAL
jgi:hypothetical protein